MPVADSSPLIYLAKVDKLYLLKELYRFVKMPEAVYREVVVKGKEKGFEDAFRVENEIGKFLFVHVPEEDFVKFVKKRLEDSGFKLGLGEIECIALCLNTNDTVLLSDDEDAKTFASVFGIKGKGTIYLLLKSCKAGLLSKRECAETFERIVRAGFWVNPEIVSLFYRTLDEI